MKVSVIIPCYNERATIEKIIERVKAVGLASEVLVVDDGSTDGTREILQALPQGDGLRVIFHDHNQGRARRCAPAFATPPATCS
ncbi:MAG: glycosyltransferase [Anaerolineae bacterium]|nr:glycosyltransferase [Anaerolineae bacterium]